MGCIYKFVLNTGLYGDFEQVLRVFQKVDENALIDAQKQRAGVKPGSLF